MPATEKTYRRAEMISLAGFLLQSLGFVALLLLSMATKSQSVFAESWHWLGGLPIWVLLLLVFHQKRLEALELLELDELRRQREAAGQHALFEVEAQDILVAGRRLRLILRYVLPITTVLLAAYHVVFGAALWLGAPWDTLGKEEIPPALYAGPSMALLAALAFLAFLLSRMALGMSKSPEWRMLRAGGSYMTGNCFVAVLLVAALGLSYFGYRVPELLVAFVVPVLMLLLGVEMVLNLVLEMYRPRVPGAEPRPAIDSRLLGLISEPGDVARSIADAMNYQFGFEISKTWFYQLLQKALGPLVLFQLAALLALSSIVVVEPGEQAVVERFGAPAGQGLQAGTHVKWPWPIDRARIVATDQIRELFLGAEEEHGHAHEAEDAELWTQDAGPQQQHGGEYDVLVVPPRLADIRAAATEPSDADQTLERGDSAPVYLLRVVGLLRYRVSDPVKYLYNYADPEAVLSAALQEAFLKFTATQDSDRLLTTERQKVNVELHRALREKVASMQPPLGIDLIDAGLLAVHPAPAVAEDYEAVASAELQYQQMIRSATAFYAQVLASVAGDVPLAEELARTIDEKEGVGADDPRAVAAEKRLTYLLAHSGGYASRIISEAEAERLQIESTELADVISWQSKLSAFQKAPSLYTASAYLDTLAEVLPGIRKYVVAAPTHDRPFVVQFEMKEQAGLLDMTQPSGSSR